MASASRLQHDWKSEKSLRIGPCCAMRAGGIASASYGTKKAG